MSDEAKALKFNKKEGVTTMTSSNKTSPASPTTSAGKDQQSIITNLTKRWTATLGKSAESILETAAILADAKAKIADKPHYERWLKAVAKMTEGTASKYRSINACTFLNDPASTAQLPPDWTVYYELSKLRTVSLFKKGAKFVSGETPTHAELASKVSELLEKPKSKETLKRTGKLVTNNQKIVAEVKELKIKVANKAYEPTAEDIKAVQEMDFDDDSNVIRFEQFNTAYKKLQREKLENKIKALLHREGLRNVEVIVRQLAQTEKVAA